MNDEDSMVTVRPGGGASLGRIDQYDLVRKLGGGGFGVVYLARDTASDMDVAIKTLHPLLKNSPEEMETLRAKFKLAARLSHPNVAAPLVLHPVREVYISDETACRELRLSPGDSVMVMRYAPGVTLSQWRKQFPGEIVPPNLALEVGRQVASALDYAHSEKIVHRDVKPGNVMVETLDDGKLRVRLLDFGLAAEIRSSMSRISNETGDVSGTRPYMAPEQWLGETQDGRTDQYALACVLYELVSGAPPFAGVFETGDPVIMLSVVEKRAPKPVAGLPEAANAALLRALAKDPKDRFPSCAAFVEALARGVCGEKDHAEFAKSAETAEAGGPGAADEAALLLRKAALQDALAAVPDADRADAGFGPAVTAAVHAFAAAEDAFKFGRPSVAARCLEQAEEALGRYRQARAARRAEVARAAAEAAERARLQREEEERRRQRQAQENARAAEAAARNKAAEEAEKRRKTRVAWGVFGLLGAVVAGILLIPRFSSSTMTTAWYDDSQPLPSVSITPAPARPTDGAPLRVTVGDVAFNVRWCPPGSFTMGSPQGEEGRYPEEVQHPVTLTRGFWMGETEVTQGLWKEVMGNNPSNNKSGDDHPVEFVSWDDCQQFVRRLNAKAPAGWRFALPTEAQWEYACRAGTTGAYGGSGRLDDMGWHTANSWNATHPVGRKAANAWGLHDMHGNVCEWCADWCGPYPSGAATDPTGPASGVGRVLRGGCSWDAPRLFCRSASRGGRDPGIRCSDLGFRLLAFQDGK